MPAGLNCHRVRVCVCARARAETVTDGLLSPAADMWAFGVVAWVVAFCGGGDLTEPYKRWRAGEFVRGRSMENLYTLVRVCCGLWVVVGCCCGLLLWVLLWLLGFRCWG